MIFFFLWWICVRSLSKFQIHKSINYSNHAVYHSPRAYLIYNSSLCLLTSFTQFSYLCAWHLPNCCPCLWAWVFVFVFQFQHINEIIRYLHFCYFTLYNALEVHLCCCEWPNFFLFYGWVIFLCVWVCVHALHHLLSIHPSRDACCFHILVIVSNAALNIGVLVILFSSGKCPEVESYAILIFRGSSIKFP